MLASVNIAAGVDKVDVALELRRFALVDLVVTLDVRPAEIGARGGVVWPIVVGAMAADPTNEVRTRVALVEALEADLVGPFYPADHPGSREEVLPLAPSRWYFTGFLAPDRDRETRDPLADDEFAGLEDEPDETAAPEPQPKQRHRFPASMDVSVLLPPGGPDRVQVQVRFAMYTPELVEDDGRKRRVWRRQPQAPEAFDVRLDAGGEEWDDQVAELQFRERVRSVGPASVKDESAVTLAAASLADGAWRSLGGRELRSQCGEGRPQRQWNGPDLRATAAPPRCAELVGGPVEERRLDLHVDARRAVLAGVGSMLDASRNDRVRAGDQHVTTAADPRVGGAAFEEGQLEVVGMTAVPPSEQTPEGAIVRAASSGAFFEIAGPSLRGRSSAAVVERRRALAIRSRAMRSILGADVRSPPPEFQRARGQSRCAAAGKMPMSLLTSTHARAERYGNRTNAVRRSISPA